MISDIARVLIIAGEPSGDAHAARLAAAMKAREPRLVLTGATGPRMRQAGVGTIVDIADLSVMGFAEVLGGAGRVARCYRRLRAAIRSDPRPSLLVLVDFPDFNIALAAVARRARIPVLYYVSPQVWAWRRGRIAKICRRVDRMIVLFPFEEEIYRSRGLDARFVGHPLAEDVVADAAPMVTRARHGLPAEGPLVALLPGSRKKTVAHNLPILLDAARRLGSKATYALAVAPGLDRAALQAAVSASGVAVALVEDDTYNLVAASDAVAVSSGTATVECALLGRPMVVVYRMSAVTYVIARGLVRVPYIAMPNIILGESVVPELIQTAMTGERVAAELAHFLDDADASVRVRRRLGELRRSLVVPGAADRAAVLALEMLG